MKWIRNTRGGSYIVEAVLVIPIFLLSVLTLLDLVPTAASCENVVFAVCDEMHLESVKSAFRQNPAALPLSLSHRIREENTSLADYHTRAYRYLYRDGTRDDLLQVRVRATFASPYPAVLARGVVFDGTVTARAFTGTLQRTPPGAPETPEDDVTVYIFPEWGERYHGKQCTYVQAACQMVYLSQDIMRSYRPCKNCNAASAQVGSPVFCFTRSGRAYHLADCRSVERYYVETTRRKAREAGYTPCTKCGGGNG